MHRAFSFAAAALLVAAAVQVIDARTRRLALKPNDMAPTLHAPSLITTRAIMTGPSPTAIRR